MENGWIKLHRKILNNDSIFRASSTFPLWCLLLLLADKNGDIKIGRHQLSKWLKIKPSTVYKALKRLQSLTMIGLKSNNKVTTISILNWGVYQQKSNNKVTTKEQQSNNAHIQEYRIKNKEYKNNNINIYTTPKPPKGEFLHFLEVFNTLFETKHKETEIRMKRYTLRRKSFSSEQLLLALENLSKSNFHRGENDHGWRATPDFLLRSDEQIDTWVNKKEAKKKTSFIKIS